MPSLYNASPLKTVADYEARLLVEVRQSGGTSYRLPPKSKRDQACLRLVEAGQLREVQQFRGCVYVEWALTA